MGRQSGFTLIELMIVVAVLALLSAIALPVYRGYVETAEEGVLVTNINTMRPFQEDFRLRNGAYAGPLADLAAIEAAIGWEPRSSDGTTYAVGGGGDAFSVTATHASGRVVCIDFPDGDRC